MPVRLNLLAEAQAAEELRRRDPVKRAAWIAVLLVAAMLGWSSWLQLKATLARSGLNEVESKITARTNEFQQVLDNQKKFGDAQKKLAALRQLATNRFLNGTVLNALQHTTIDDVQLMKFKVDQTFTLNEETKPRTNASGRVLLGKPASVTERIALNFEAKDSASNPGDQVNKFKQALAQNPYFQTVLGKTNEVKLTKLDPPTILPDAKAFVLFTLQCPYPEKTR